MQIRKAKYLKDMILDEKKADSNTETAFCLCFLKF